MAPVEASLMPSHADGVSDSARARELYKYYQPNAPISTEISFPNIPSKSSALPSKSSELQDDDDKSHSAYTKISSSDTALTSFCQLVTWRTGAQRAMISLIDDDTQYFVAESTKTVDLIDNQKHAPGDGIWIGCANVSKAGRLCERTIAVLPTKTGEYPSFIVNDLRQDRRFNKLPFVAGPPYFRYYAGVPLVTKRGIPIGSLFVIDDRVGQGNHEDDVQFMGTMAQTTMRHLEMAREVEEHRRGMKMSRGLASFVEGRAELVEAEVEVEDSEGTKIAGHFQAGTSLMKTKSKGSTRSSTKSGVDAGIAIERNDRDISLASQMIDQASPEVGSLEESHVRPDLGSGSQTTSFGGTSVSIPSPKDLLGQPGSAPGDDLSEGSAMKLLFSRAANLIREAFEVDGGAVFLDAQRGFGGEQNRSPEARRASNNREFFQPELQTSSDDHSSGEQVGDQGEEGEPRSPSQRQAYSPELGEGMFSRSSSDSSRQVEVLGFSTPEASSINGDALPGPQNFKPFDERALGILLKRFPRGKLWSFDSGGGVPSSAEEDTLRRTPKGSLQKDCEVHKRKVGSARIKSDARYLSRHFPGVRQLLFVPLWDAARSRWLSCCFAWSVEPTRILSKQGELAFLTAFGNSVMAECSRLDTEIADQKKGDFIGSISHELRSPLHGILASAEFLGDEITEGFAKSLVETIDSCGRTLLDTINHILDFSKINHFEKTWRRNKRGNRPAPPNSGGSTTSIHHADLPMINLFAEVDVSVVCEEVVEGVFAGHVFQNVTAQSFDMVPGSQGKISDQGRSSVSPNSLMGTDKSQVPEVAVILDVDVDNYKFTTQPGAFRRVIMNLLGNALKYTSFGYVRIKLEATEMADLETAAAGNTELTARSKITLTVTDTGKGISSDFLRSKLFTPFAQENSLSSGTGLGLSIVRSIVALLEGDITIDSEVGRGTEVRVTLPLPREMPKTTDPTSSIKNPKSTSSVPHESNQSIIELRNRVLGRRVSLHGFGVDDVNHITQRTSQLLKASVANYLTKWYGFQVVPPGQRVSVMVLNEANPSTVFKLAKQASTNHRNHPAILVLCSHLSKLDLSSSISDSKCKVGFMIKPVGPLKLARALLQCLEGGPGKAPAPTPGLFENTSAQFDTNDLSNVFEELSFSAQGGEMLDNSRMATDSENARKAIESPTPNALIEKQAEFPFPTPSENTPKNLSIDSTKASPKDPANLKFTSGSSRALASINVKDESVSRRMSTANAPSTRQCSPSLLLVDDNKINLKLLYAFMHKKKYDVIDQAENGLEAVNKVRDRASGYDIIFMDISMPVLDGFGATREIRAIEQSRRAKTASSAHSNSTNPSKEANQSSIPLRKNDKALIIALTGLASQRDQKEAANSGVDIFLTKPVRFKEVGKMLDNWEANKEREMCSSPLAHHS